MYIGLNELSRRTGATIRQLDYWSNNEVIFPIGEKRPGSGHKRKFDEDIINRVKLLVKVSKAFTQPLCLKELQKIYDRYSDQFVDLGDGVVLSWR